ncbi:hypothetical protein BN1723_004332 [Verticillium longisporum]|uniref:Uncharacterized protein n=1 Tax=Verticillium longisporum TaxID=100787 RepID=A0A0G4MUT5_VERLO|nr:hypothetical protein BN1723_004332 [Verticillium longisporum]
MTTFVVESLLAAPVMVNITISLQLALAASSLVSSDGLNARAKARGRYWGTAINPSVMSDSRANPIASNG